MTSPINTVHLVFKTHFDFGFTDFAREVTAQYNNVFIPQVLETAQCLRQEESTQRVIWTTGAWLIYEYLEHASPLDRRRMEEAIEAGDIAWHGLPFTTHSELMDASLFRYGLKLSQTLDRRFGKRTIAAKMTDVPGHTRAMVPLLAEAGIKFLHIGVNEAATPPDVPPLFVWQDESGADVMVMYQHAYGEAMVLPGLSDGLAFGFTNDNLGPQSPEQIQAIFHSIQMEFPGAHVQASTLDAYATALLRIKSQLPIVTGEIGDTWIHGVGTDPGKVSRYRALCRLRTGWLADTSIRLDDQLLAEFSHRLLCVPEHTWGLDEKTHLDDYQQYGQEAFQATRTKPPFLKMESSWTEQRAYLDRALEGLGDTSFAEEARNHLKTLVPVHPDMQGFESVSELSTLFETAHFSLRFDAATGSINRLVQKQTGRNWATPDHLLGWIRYQTFSQSDYDRFLSQYLVRKPEWAILDNCKPGIEQAGAESQWWVPSVSGLFAREDAAGHYFLLEIAMPLRCTTLYGCPRLFTVEVNLPKHEPTIHITLQWFDKPACRLPEAVWYSFTPVGTDRQGWFLEKLGQHLSPLDVVRNGNRKLHAIDREVCYRENEQEFKIETLDAPLVAPGTPSLLDFNNTQPDLEQGVHFNLYNNVWGTNFPMWYEEDARFQFVIHSTVTSSDKCRNQNQ
jgi:hypothetical protein